MWRHSLHVSGFFYALRKPPAGRVGAYRIRPPTHAPVYGANTCSSCSNTVSSSFKHDSNVIQIRPCGPSVRAYAIRPYSGTRIMYPAFLTGVPDASGLCRGRKAGRVPQSPYQANFAGVRPLPRLGSWPGTSKARTKQTSPASGLCRGWEVGRVPQQPVPSKLRRRP